MPDPDVDGLLGPACRRIITIGAYWRTVDHVKRTSPGGEIGCHQEVLTADTHLVERARVAALALQGALEQLEADYAGALRRAELSPEELEATSHQPRGEW